MHCVHSCCCHPDVLGPPIPPIPGQVVLGLLDEPQIATLVPKAQALDMWKGYVWLFPDSCEYYDKSVNDSGLLWTFPFHEESAVVVADYALDALYAMAYALESLINNRKDLYYGPALFEALTKVEFLGKTGASQSASSSRFSSPSSSWSSFCLALALALALALSLALALALALALGVALQI